MTRLLAACLLLMTLCACARNDGNAGVLCAQNLSGEGYDACVRNASRF